MRACLLAVVAAVLIPLAVWCQPSMPTYWKYAPPEPAMLIGIDWRQTSQSSLSPLAGGALQGLPNLDFAEEIGSVLVAVEPGAGDKRFLAAVVGRFNLTKLRHMAAAEGARTGRYRGAEFFSAGGTDIAALDAHSVLVGDTKSVRAAIDRGNTVVPRESPLWRRAAELSSTYSIWFACTSLQAMQPVQAPLLAEVRSIDGGIALQRGFEMMFDLVASSEEAAQTLAGALEAALHAGVSRSPFSQLFRPATVQTAGSSVKLTASLDVVQMETSLKSMLAAGPPGRRGLMDWIVSGSQPVETAAAPAATPAVRPVRYEPKATAPPPQKKMIRIIGLEDGTREIPFPSLQH